MSVEDPATTTPPPAVAPSPGAGLVPANPDYPAKLDVPYPGPQSRLELFLRWLRVIPAAIWVFGYAFVATFSLLLNNLTILFTGKYREQSFRTLKRMVIAQNQLVGYLHYLTDQAPVWGGPDPNNPVQIELPEELPTVSSRFRPLYVWLLAIPATFGVMFGMFGAYFMAAFGGFWSILLTGRYSEGSFRYVAIRVRKAVRLAAFQLMMTEEPPPSGTAS
jgi:hypothetical protein